MTSCNILKNAMDIASANLLVEAVKDKDVSLCGIKPEQTEANFKNQDLGPADAVLIASDLSKPGVTGSLTTVWIPGHKLCMFADRLTWCMLAVGPLRKPALWLRLY